MLEATAEFDDLDASRREIDAGEVFMLTFATVGVLALLETDAANAALPDGSAPLSEQNLQLRAIVAPATDASDALGPPAAADAAFLDAIAALSPPDAEGFDALGNSPSPAASDALAPPSGLEPDHSLNSQGLAGSENAPGGAFDPTLADDNILAPIVANDILGSYVGSSAPPQSALPSLATGAGLSTTGASLQLPTNSPSGNPATPIGFASAGESEAIAAVSVSNHLAIRESSLLASQTAASSASFTAAPGFATDLVSLLEVPTLFGGGAAASLAANEILQALGEIHVVFANVGRDALHAY